MLEKHIDWYFIYCVNLGLFWIETEQCATFYH